MFHANPILTALNPRRAVGGKNVILFSEIIAGNLESIEGYYIPRIHRDRVKQVGLQPTGYNHSMFNAIIDNISSLAMTHT